MADLYGSPGHADQLSDALRQAWNTAIGNAYEAGLTDFTASNFKKAEPTRFLSATPLADAVRAPVTWLPVPRQPLVCLGRDTARRLCDHGEFHDAGGHEPAATLAGGREWHNEYCEYRIIRRPDRTGALRPKRVEITTELREYWVCVAREDPDRLLELAREVLCTDEVRGEPEPTLQALYGVDAPESLSPDDRQTRFVAQTAGSDTRSDRVSPAGPLNRRRALFMCHPINGLDDIFYITAFGAQPFARQADGRRQPVPVPWVFLATPYFSDSLDNLRQLRDTYCRHADPAATAAAYAAAYTGRRIALADPPGVYMRPADFDAAALRCEDRPIADLGWIRWRRPDQGPLHQRLVIGPPDDEPDAFLDDIVVRRGSREVPLLGGYQLLELLAVGPEVLVEREPAEIIPENEYLYLEPDTRSIRCGTAQCLVCQELDVWRKRLLAGEPGDPVRAPGWRNRQMSRSLSLSS